MTKEPMSSPHHRATTYFQTKPTLQQPQGHSAFERFPNERMQLDEDVSAEQQQKQ
jgi:hypothetical protein